MTVDEIMVTPKYIKFLSFGFLLALTVSIAAYMKATKTDGELEKVESQISTYAIETQRRLISLEKAQQNIQQSADTIATWVRRNQVSLDALKKIANQ